MKGKTCSFTVQRPQQFHWESNESGQLCLQLKNQLQEEIKRMITQQQVRHFLCSMELGTEMWAAEIVLKLKADYPITLECVMSHEGVADHWSEKDRDWYFSIVQRADYETMLQTRYTSDCEDKCSQYLEKHSDAVIAVRLSEHSGTVEAVEKGREKPMRGKLRHPRLPQYLVLL